MVRVNAAWVNFASESSLGAVGPKHARAPQQQRHATQRGNWPVRHEYVCISGQAQCAWHVSADPDANHAHSLRQLAYPSTRQGLPRLAPHRHAPRHLDAVVRAKVRECPRRALERGRWSIWRRHTRQHRPDAKGAPSPPPNRHERIVQRVPADEQTCDRVVLPSVYCMCQISTCGVRQRALAPRTRRPVELLRPAAVLAEPVLHKPHVRLVTAIWVTSHGAPERLVANLTKE